MIDKAGADLVSLTENIDTTTAAGRMFFGVLAVMNQFERRPGQRADQAGRGLQALAGRGVGHPPLRPGQGRRRPAGRRAGRAPGHR